MAKKTKHPKAVQITYSEEEWLELKDRISGSTCRSATQYLRKITLGQPVVYYTRNRSFDRFIDESLALRGQLKALAENPPIEQDDQHHLITLFSKIHLELIKLSDYVSMVQTREASRRHYQLS